MKAIIKAIVMLVLFSVPAMAEEKNCNFTETLHSKMLFRGGGLVATTGSASTHVVNCSFEQGFYIGAFFLTPHQDFWIGAEEDLWLGWSKSWGNFTLDLVAEVDYFSVEPGFTMAAVVPKATVSYKVTSGVWGTWQVYVGLESGEFIHGDDGYDRRLVGGSILSINLDEKISWNTDLHCEFHDTTFKMQYGTRVCSVTTGPRIGFEDKSALSVDFLAVDGGFGPKNHDWAVKTSYTIPF